MGKTIKNSAKKRPVEKAAIPDHAKFLRLIARNIKPSEAKKRSGFSPNYSTTRLLQSKHAKLAMQKVEESRNQLAVTPGTSYHDAVEVYQEVRDYPGMHPDTRIKAQTRIDKLQGYEAPVKQDVTQRNMSLIIELDGLSPDELAAIEKREVILG